MATAVRDRAALKAGPADRLRAVVDDDALWAALGRETRRRMTPTFRALLEAGAEAARGVAGEKQLEVDTELMRIMLADVLPTYMDTWWGQIEVSSREALRRAMTKMTREGLGLEYLVKQLEIDFGPMRAERIAVTETTRLFAKGALTAYRAAGVAQVEWLTVRDPAVCQLCAPLDGRTWTLGAHEEPPRHVNCRCVMSPVAPVPETI